MKSWPGPKEWRTVARRRAILPFSGGGSKQRSREISGLALCHQLLLARARGNLLLTVQRGQRKNVMIAETGDGAGEHRLDPLTLAKFAGDVVSQALAGRLAHEAEAFANFGVWDDVQVRRLLELHGQSLLQRTVEDRIARGVDEIGEENAVFLRELGGLPGAKEKYSGDDGRERDHGHGEQPH